MHEQEEENEGGEREGSQGCIMEQDALVETELGTTGAQAHLRVSHLKGKQSEGIFHQIPGCVGHIASRAINPLMLLSLPMHKQIILSALKALRSIRRWSLMEIDAEGVGHTCARRTSNGQLVYLLIVHRRE